jgi:DNA replication protein DnaC
MNDQLQKQLHFLGLKALEENWDTIFTQAKKSKPSYHNFLTDILAKEYSRKKENARQARIKKANIPELWTMETFPFNKQPRLKYKLIKELYDSSSYLTDKQDLIFIGPTGSGKTGLATAFLLQAINQGHRGYFIDFRKLLEMILRAQGDHTEDKLLSRFQNDDILLIDEVGYTSVPNDLAGVLFELLKRRLRQSTTIMTSQFGFEEWNKFLHDKHLIAALLDRLTVNCALFNMQHGSSLRPKSIVYATKDTLPSSK